MPTTDQLTLHVAMVSETFSPFVGGVAAQLQSCAQALQKRNIHVSIITKQLPNCAPQETVNGIQVYRIPTYGVRGLASPAFVIGAVQKLRQLRPNLLHAHELLLPTTAALLAKQILRIPLVVTVHASGAEIGEVARLQRARFGTLRMAQLRHNVDAFVAISRVTDADLAGAAISAEKRRAIPNGIDMTRFAPVSEAQKRALRQSLKIEDVPTVIYTGRLSSEKRVMHLVDMWRTIRQAHPTAQLLIVGDGPQAGLLRSRASEGVHFASDQHDVAPWLQSADIFVMPSVSEGFSLSTLEALAVGLPCVATAVGAIPEFITHGENGLLVRTDDKLSLQNGIINLLTNGELRMRFAGRARASVEKRYSIEGVASQLHDLYREMCEMEWGAK